MQIPDRKFQELKTWFAANAPSEYITCTGLTNAARELGGTPTDIGATELSMNYRFNARQFSIDVTEHCYINEQSRSNVYFEGFVQSNQKKSIRLYFTLLQAKQMADLMHNIVIQAER